MIQTSGCLITQNPIPNTVSGMATRCRLHRAALVAVVMCLLFVDLTIVGAVEQPVPTAKLPETGTNSEALASFDSMMCTFLRDNTIPGGALAVAKDGRLVYARGFGFADVDAREPVQPTSLFRIASISKPITAVALLRLVEEKRVGLDDRVFELLPNKPHLPAGQQVDSRLQQITVRQLLQHRGGWDRGRSMDPMFRAVRIASSLGVTPPAQPKDIISFMLGRKLDFDPGSQYVYSNFGYCMLGRVIEQASGDDYETYVQRQVLQPLNIHRMRIGRSLEDQRFDDEVKYYTSNNERGRSVVGSPIGRQVPQPYGTWSVEATDAHGGWIGSAVDLVRFGSQVQQWKQSHVLTADTNQAMLTRPPGAAGHLDNGKPKDSFYGLGWQVRDVGQSHNLWHTGALAGTSTLLVLRHDGLCWAVLFNTTYTPDHQRPASKIDSLIHKAANSVKHWPAHDLFPELLAR